MKEQNKKELLRVNILNVEEDYTFNGYINNEDLPAQLYNLFEAKPWDEIVTEGTFDVDFDEEGYPIIKILTMRLQYEEQKLIINIDPYEYDLSQIEWNINGQLPNLFLAMKGIDNGKTLH